MLTTTINPKALIEYIYRGKGYSRLLNSAILNNAKKKGYKTTSKATSVLTYAKEEVELSEGKAAKVHFVQQ